MGQEQSPGLTALRSTTVCVLQLGKLALILAPALSLVDPPSITQVGLPPLNGTGPAILLQNLDFCIKSSRHYSSARIDALLRWALLA